jgi:hypothetical protein
MKAERYHSVSSNYTQKTISRKVAGNLNSLLLNFARKWKAKLEVYEKCYGKILRKKFLWKSCNKKNVTILNVTKKLLQKLQKNGKGN